MRINKNSVPRSYPLVISILFLYLPVLGTVPLCLPFQHVAVSYFLPNCVEFLPVYAWLFPQQT